MTDNTNQGPMGQLAALRVEHDELKRSSAAEKNALTAERDALAKEVEVLKGQVKDASKFGEWMLEVKPDENSEGTKDTDCRKEDDKMDVDESSEDKAVPFASLSATGENIVKHMDSGTKLVVDIVADQFDEDGYIKALLPGEEGSGKHRSLTMPTAEELAAACDVVKNHVEGGTQQAMATVADQFDEDGYIKALLPGDEPDENNMPTLPTTKELTHACEAVKNNIEDGAKRALTSVADQFDENGYMKCCMTQE